MAVITAYSPVGPLSNTPSSVDFSTQLSGFGPVVNSPPVQDYDSSDTGFSLLTSNLPISEGAAEITAWRMPTFLDDYYFRIHVYPSEVSLGNILSAKVQTVEVWNAYFEPKLLSEIVESGTGGISLNQPVTPPATFGALESQLYQVTIATLGPAVVDAYYQWQFPDEAPKVRLTGRRIVVFPFRPNWRSPITETLEWLTQVLRSYDGSEQRRSLRNRARRSFAYSVMVKGDETARFENLLWGWQNRFYAIPVWTDKLHLVGDHGDDVRTLHLDNPIGDYSFSSGGLAIIYKDSGTFEVVEVDSFVGSTLTLLRPTTMGWDDDTLVMPCVVGHMPASVSTMRYTSNVLVATIDITCDPLQTDPFTPEAAAPLVVDSLEVITRQPNWKSTLNNNFQYAASVVDKSTGAIKLMQTEEFPRITRNYPWLLKDRAHIRAYREMLGRLRGQAKTVLIPSWHDDFKLIMAIGATDNAISVADNEFLAMVGDDPARNRIAIRLYDGSTYYRRITSVSTNGNAVQLFIDSPLGVEIRLDEVQTIHVLMRSRLATDRVDIVWHTDTAAVVQNSFITVKE